MRTTNAGVALAFATHGYHAKAESNNMHCEYGTLYSYETPVAVFVTDPEDDSLVVVIDTFNYSVTTRKQLALVRKYIVESNCRVIETTKKLLPQMKWDELKERNIV